MLAPSEQANSSCPTITTAETSNLEGVTDSPTEGGGSVEQQQQQPAASVPASLEVIQVETEVEVHHADVEETDRNCDAGEASVDSPEEDGGVGGGQGESGEVVGGSGDAPEETVQVTKEEPLQTKVEEVTVGGASESEQTESIQTIVEEPRVEEQVKVEDDIVRAKFVDFVEETPSSLECAEEDAGDDDDGILLMGNPELQKIRAEQVRKWLIFEQENPTSSTTSMGSSLTESMEVDSLAAAQSGESTMVNGADAAGDGPEGNGRRVRFLTDQEGNLLISVFMTNTPTATTPLSEETSMLSNGPREDEGDAVASATAQSPSLVVSPPSLEHSNGQEVEEEEQLVDSIEPSAPPLEAVASEDEAPSLVLVENEPPKEPPQEKPPAPPTEGDDAANDSSDETLSVGSCSSMIEVTSGADNTDSPPQITLDREVNTSGLDLGAQVTPNQKEADKEDNNNNKEKEEREDMVESVGIESSDAPAPCFQFSVASQEPKAAQENGAVEENNNNIDDSNEEESSTQPSSLIIHELEEHNEGMASLNTGEVDRPASPPVNKVPNVDENNNVVEDSVLEEEEDDDEEELVPDVEPSNEIIAPVAQPMELKSEEPIMPELRRSTSSSDGEVDEEIPEQRSRVPLQQAAFLGGHLGPPPEDDQEAQMVSLCIQEEHISSVAVSIARWESLVSKAQSTENLSVTPNMSGTTSPSAHAPVTKSASSPCPKTTSAAYASSPSPQKPPAVPPKPANLASVTSNLAKDAPPHPQHQHVNRLVVIHRANSPVHEPVLVTKAAGWSCWGNKVKETSSAPSSGGIYNANDQNSGPNDEIIYAQPNHQAGSTMTSITNPSTILKSYPKPLSKGEIMNWLREGEVHRAGLLLSHHHTGGNHLNSPVLVSWFFGLISRQQAERYLQGQAAGTYLVRISTRIWGYTLSYQAANGRTKHFLISAINPAVPATLETAPPSEALPPQSCKQQRMSPFLPQGRYAFIGTNMNPYGTLVSLIRHHSHAPITKLGGEKLLNPCPGGPQVTGLESIFQNQKLALAAAPVTPSTSQLMIHSS